MILHDFLDKFNSQKKTFLEKVKKINGALAFITLSTLLIAFLVSSISSLSHNHLYYILSPLLLSIFTSSSTTYLFFKKHITMKDKKDIQGAQARGRDDARPGPQ